MALIFNDISKRFGEKTLFSHLSLEFEEKGLYSLIGASGSGKTTLLRMIAGLDNDYSGSIEGGGIENVSIMFQEYRLFPTLTAYENAIIPNGDKNDPSLQSYAIDLFKTLGFNESEMQLHPDQLSGGMKQRVSFIRAILRDKPILLLDEPTKELNESVRNEMTQIILSESKKRTVILVSHNENEHVNLNSTSVYLAPQETL